MKLQAVTICVHYSEFLRFTVSNRRHFDRWLIITVHSDIRTQKLCEELGLEVLVSRELATDGMDFDAAYNKSSVLNEGLNRLAQDGWVLILDSDVVLPRHFRERVEAAGLRSGTLYGVKGRRTCRDGATLEKMINCEPWDDDLLHNSQPLGYFNLFDLNSSPNRYPASMPHRDRPHDDQHFAWQFPPSARVCLPFGVLHLGEPGKGWRVRSAASNHLLRTSLSKSSSLSDDLPEAFERRPVGAGAMAGFFPDETLAFFARKTSQLYLIDQHQIFQLSNDALTEADRAFLRRKLEVDLEQLHATTKVVPYSITGIAKIPDASLDFLFLSGGNTTICESLLASLPLFLRKLKAGATLCGNMFFREEWPAGITTIISIFGTPHFVTKTGLWRKQISSCLREQLLAGTVANTYDAGVVVLNTTRETEAGLMTLHSVREHWKGPILLQHFGDDQISVRLGCWKLGAEFRHAASNAIDYSLRELNVTEIARCLPFERALILKGGTLASGPIAPLFTSQSPPTGSTSAPQLCVRSANAAYSLRAAEMAHCTDITIGAPLVVCEGDPGQWSDAAWDHWTMRKLSMLDQFAVEIRVRPNATVAFIVQASELGDFQQKAPLMRFPRGTPIIFALLDVDDNDLWIPGPTPDRILRFSTTAVPPLGILRSIAEACSTSHLIFVSTTAYPLPGAELFLGDWDHYDLLLHRPAALEQEYYVTHNVFVPREFMGMVRRDYLTNLADNRKEPAPSISTALFLASRNGSGKSLEIDMTEQGWALEPVCEYIPSRILCEDSVPTEHQSGNAVPRRSPVSEAHLDART